MARKRVGRVEAEVRQHAQTTPRIRLDVRAPNRSWSLGKANPRQPVSSTGGPAYGVTPTWPITVRGDVAAYASPCHL